MGGTKTIQHFLLKLDRVVEASNVIVRSSRPMGSRHGVHDDTDKGHHNTRDRFKSLAPGDIASEQYASAQPRG